MEDVQATNPATEVHTPASEDAPNGSPGFGERGRMRRRARFLRKARELAYRDLGGLVFSLHRFGQRNDALVLAKLSTLGQIDAELRALEDALAEHQPVTVLRNAGIAACQRCAAIHGSEDHFCPNCGLAMDRHAERPVAGPPASVTPAPAPTPAPVPAPSPARGATSPAAAHMPAPAHTPAPAAAHTPAPTHTPAPAPTPGVSPAVAVPTPATNTAPADPAPAVPPGPPPAAPAATDHTTIDRPSPQTPPPAAPTTGVPAEAPNDQDQPTVIVRPPGSGA